MPRVRLRVPGRDELVEVDLDPAAIVASSSGSGALVCDGQVVPFHATSDGATIEVWVGGQTWTFEAAAARGRSRRAAGAHAHAPTSDELTAPMPGTILEVRVKPGDVVTAHQPVIVMVSMKMEMSLGAPCAGRVAAVDVAPGRAVDMGQRLVKIQPEASGAS